MAEEKPRSLISEHYIRVRRSARYYLIGRPGDDVSELWYVLHGYGQLAGYFIRHFEPIASPHRLIVAPEGLSRFYLTDRERRVGATWMTREDRLREMEDYIAYLNQLHEQLCESLKRAQLHIVILGFSQGTATATRWAFHGQAKPERLILWAGGLPPEIDFSATGFFSEQCRLDLVFGDTDPYIDTETLRRETSRLDAQGVAYRMHTFKGAHQIDPHLLQILAGEGAGAAGQ